MFKNQKSTAAVVDGKLILSFPNASTPVVWQMDLLKTTEMAIEMRKNEEEGGFSLVLKKAAQRGDKIIANFDREQEATSGLIATSKALKEAHGKMAHMQAQSDGGVSLVQAASPARAGSLGKIALVLILVVGLVGLYNMAQNMQLQQVRAEIGSPGASASAPSQVGVPLSADDFLNRR